MGYRYAYEHPFCKLKGSLWTLHTLSPLLLIVCSTYFGHNEHWTGSRFITAPGCCLFSPYAFKFVNKNFALVVQKLWMGGYFTRSRSKLFPIVHISWGPILGQLWLASHNPLLYCRCCNWYDKTFFPGEKLQLTIRCTLCKSRVKSYPRHHRPGGSHDIYPASWLNTS